MALYLQDVGTSSGYATALDFVPMAAAMIIASLFAGRWVARVGPRLPMTVGCVLAGVGIILTEVVLTPNSGLSSLGWTLPIAGAGFGIAIVPVTSTALSALPAQHSGMAASATNTSRELGAVAGVAVLGSMVNGQLISSLVRQLNMIGIPKSFQDTVITAVTTGTFSSQAKQFKGTPAITKIVREVTQAAYCRVRPWPRRRPLGCGRDDAPVWDRRRPDDACAQAARGDTARPTTGLNPLRSGREEDGRSQAAGGDVCVTRFVNVARSPHRGGESRPPGRNTAATLGNRPCTNSVNTSDAYWLEDVWLS